MENYPHIEFNASVGNINVCIYNQVLFLVNGLHFETSFFAVYKSKTKVTVKKIKQDTKQTLMHV